MRYRGQQRRRKPARLTTSQSHAAFVSPPVIGGCTHAPVIIGGDCGFHADLLAEPVVLATLQIYYCFYCEGATNWPRLAGRNGSRGSGRRKHRERVERHSQRPPRPLPPSRSA